MSNNKLLVIDRDGTNLDLVWEPDQTLMEAVRDNDLPVLASCGGTASCATCHVFLEKEVFDTLAEPRGRQPDSEFTKHACQMVTKHAYGGDCNVQQRALLPHTASRETACSPKQHLVDLLNLKGVRRVRARAVLWP